MDNKERRNSGLLYYADDAAWVEMKKARRLTQKINTIDRSNFKKINKLVQKLFKKADETTFVNPPFYCDYGNNIEVGKNFFANYNCVILDCARVKFGDNCFLAPNVAIYTAGHPLHHSIRNTGYEYAIEIVFGDNVWVGGNVVVCPGVKIGNNVVIGAGSVVTKDIPDNSLAAGNPFKVIRQITDEDKNYYFKDRKIDEETLSLIKNR